MKKATKIKMMHGLMTVAVTLFAILLCATSLANSRASFINNALGTTNYTLKQVGTDDNVDATYFKSEYTTLKDMIEAKNEVAVEISREGSVLLKNDNGALPLDKSNETVTIWGLNSHNPVLGGNIGSNVGVNASAGQKLYGIKEALAERGFDLNQQFIDFYASSALDDYRLKASMFGNVTYGHGLTTAFTPSMPMGTTYPVGEAPASAYGADLLNSAKDTAAVVVLTRDSSEAADYLPTMTNSTPGDSNETTILGLSNYEKAMLELAKANSTKVIVLINADNQMEIEELKTDDEIDSILWVGAPGVNGFLGVADILSGDAVPSGHLTDTYAVSSLSSPAMKNFGSKNFDLSGVEIKSDDRANWFVVENEGIYVGYKYYETRYEDQIMNSGNATSTVGSSTNAAWDYAKEVSYPFGYGLSYTTFKQELKSVELTVGGTGRAVVEVTNTGDYDGKSVVQLYVQAPYTSGGLEKSAVQLIGFGKTDVLAKNGGHETVTIEFDPVYMASYDEKAVKRNGKAGAWVLEEGNYYFAIGNGAHHALNNIIALKDGSKTSSLIRINNEEVNANNAILWNLNSTDMETYSENVENALQDMDVNTRIPDTVEYVTRSDWTKGWETITTITPTAEMVTELKNAKFQLTENGKAGDVIWGAKNGLNAANFILLDDEGKYAGVVDFSDPQWDRLVEQIDFDEAVAFIEQGGDKNLEPLLSINLGESIWYDGPIGVAPDQLLDYTVRWDSSNEVHVTEPTYVKADDECATWKAGGMPTEPIVASTFNYELVYLQGVMFGEESLWINNNALCGPGLNLHRTPYNARNHEYYSEDSVLTSLMGEAVCKGALTKGLQMMPKHLAFNHQEDKRAAIATFMNEQSARENELRGFYGCMANNYALGCMTAFNRAGTLFSGAHPGLQEQIIRNEWGFTGWLITDMINGGDYMNWRDVVFGGGGTCCTSNAYANTAIGSMTSDANKELIKKDMAFQEKMQTALKYFVYNEIRSNTMNGVTANMRFVYVRTWWQNTLIAADVIIGVAAAAAAAVYVLMIVRKKKEA